MRNSETLRWLHSLSTVGIFSFFAYSLTFHHSLGATKLSIKWKCNCIQRLKRSRLSQTRHNFTDDPTNFGKGRRHRDVPHNSPADDSRQKILTRVSPALLNNLSGDWKRPVTINAKYLT